MLANPQIVLLKEGTDTSQGVPQIIGNIIACNGIADAIRTTLGPRGMDKIIIDDKSNATISNDGAEILKKLDIVHPVGATLVQIALSQDDEVGDGTTSVVLLASEFLKNAKPFIEEGVHPELIQKAYRRATKLLLNKLHNELAVRILDDKHDAAKKRELLIRCAATALSSKLVAGHKQFFAEMVVDAVQMLSGPTNDSPNAPAGNDLKPLDMIGIKKVAGGSLQDSKLIAGVAFKKTFSYAGFEMQPKHYQGGVKIALLNIELEIKAERENAEIRVTNVEEYEKVYKAEWTILYEKLEALVKAGAKIVLSKLPIGDVATQYFADRDMFCAGRVADKDLERTRKACGGAILTSVSDLNTSAANDVLGTCQEFHEMQIGGERYNLFTGCPQSRTCTLILRGGADQFMEETERSLHDAIMIVRRAMVNHAIVAGGGAIDMELSRYLRDVSLTIKGRDQQFYAAMARSFETIPRTLCENAGLDATNMLNLLRHAHAKGQKWAGLDIENETVTDNFEACVWEPALVKGNAITAASEAACIVLTLDETIRNAKSKTPEDNRPVMPGGGGRGRGRNGRPMM